MMTAQLLTLELSSLIQESKRKNPDLRNAAEKSLSDLKALPSTSETQLAADLKRRPSFARPFILACGAKPPKLVGNGITALLRLIVSNGLSSESLKDVLQALRDCTSQALDVQLKVLQAISSLLQNYGRDLQGKLLVSAFQVCFLLHASKTAVASNTAAATLQQLLSFTFEKVASEDAQASNPEPQVAVHVGNESVSVSSAAADAYHLLNDVCILTEGGQPKTVIGASLAPVFGLELIETVLGSNAETIDKHEEQRHVLRSRLIPLVTRILSEKVNFSLTVRAVRVLRLLIRRWLHTMIAEMELTISLVNHLLDPNTSASWKRVLLLELIKDLYEDTNLIRFIYALYDEKEGRKNIIGDQLATLVRLAAEKPVLIGLAQSDSEPNAGNGTVVEPMAADMSGFASVIDTSSVETDLNKPIISVRWSIVRIPIIESADKTDPPPLPITYLYSLVLTCINGFSEGLSKFLLPFTVKANARSKRRTKSSTEDQGQARYTVDDDGEGLVQAKDGQDAPRSLRKGKDVPVNPLSLEDHESYDQIRAAALAVERCWPALLAASSTFFNAALDAEYHHSLVRSFQKFTQIAGLLDLATPRDAFLTTLAKQAVPKIASRFVPSSTPQNFGDDEVDDDSRSDDGSSHPESLAMRQKYLRRTSSPVNTRNLLCLRALLNLGTALGPTLGSSWSIVFETLHNLDLALIGSAWQQKNGQWQIPHDFKDRPHGQLHVKMADLNAEMSAVEVAAARLQASTGDLFDEVFRELLQSLCILIRNSSGLCDEIPGKSVNQLAGSESLQQSAVKHQRLGSTSRVTVSETAVGESVLLLLDKLGQIGQRNITRLSQVPPVESGWPAIVGLLTDHLRSPDVEAAIRIHAARQLNELVTNLASLPSPSSQQQDDVVARCLDAILAAVSRVWSAAQSTYVHSCGPEIHMMELAALSSILEKCGDDIVAGWKAVFTIITSTFETITTDGDDKQTVQRTTFRSKSSKLIRSSFASLQLICSDFLTAVPDQFSLLLIDTLYQFCSQDQDLNISLTCVALFRNVSDYLQSIGENGERRIAQENIRDSVNEEEFITALDTNITAIALSKVWIYLLLRLRYLATDHRPEVRHSSLHTLFGILDGSGDVLRPRMWTLCFRVIFFGLLSPAGKDKGGNSWDETSALIIKSVSKVFASLLQSFPTHGALGNIWVQLVQCYGAHLSTESLMLNQAVFATLTEILSGMQTLDERPSFRLEPAWTIWEAHNPATYRPLEKTDNHAALTAYLEYIHQLHFMLPTGYSAAQVATVILHLTTCITESTPVIYGSDVDEMTQVQKLALEEICSIKTADPAISVEVIKAMGNLVMLAFQTEEHGRPKSKSFVALSLAAMDALRDLVKEHNTTTDRDTLESLATSLSSLKVPIQFKYKWQTESKKITSWRKATSTALSMLDTEVLSHGHGDSQSLDKLWTFIVEINDGIVAADTDCCDSNHNVGADQAFDIESFLHLQGMTIPRIGSASIPDRIRRKYVESLFEHSTIHEAHPDDLARPDQELLDGLGSKHIGRVQDLPPRLRSKMSYVLLDHLFELVAVHDGSKERVKLAQAAAPYLILRVGLVLKAYICDQPLRGRMPQPLSQKREMHYVLKKLVEMESEPKGIPDTMGVQSEHKKHLFLLFGLVTQALKAARGDEEMSERLRGLVEAVGMGFRI